MATTLEGTTDERLGADGYVRVHVERLLDMLPIAGYVCNEDGLLIHYNAAAIKLWGQAPRLLDPRQRFCGSYRLCLGDGTPVAHADCPMADSLRTGDPVRDQQVIIERPDGSRTLALASIEALRDDTGRIVGALNWLREATESLSAARDDAVVLTFEKQIRQNAKARGRRKRLTEVASAGDSEQQSIRYFRELLQVLPAATYTTDAVGRITFYNDAAVDLWGVAPELGKSEFCGSWKLTGPTERLWRTTNVRWPRR